MYIIYILYVCFYPLSPSSIAPLVLSSLPLSALSSLLDKPDVCFLAQEVREALSRELIIQKDLPARVGMRVVGRELSLSLDHVLAKQSGRGPGTIVWMEPANLQENIQHAATVDVIWDSNIKKRCVGKHVKRPTNAWKES